MWFFDERGRAAQIVTSSFFFSRTRYHFSIMVYFRRQTPQALFFFFPDITAFARCSPKAEKKRSREKKAFNGAKTGRKKKHDPEKKFRGLERVQIFFALRTFLLLQDYSDINHYVKYWRMDMVFCRRVHMLLYEQCIIINILSKSVHNKHFYIIFWLKSVYEEDISFFFLIKCNFLFVSNNHLKFTHTKKSPELFFFLWVNNYF